MNRPTCAHCNSSRVLSSGARVGTLWCFVKRVPVAPECLCPSFARDDSSNPAGVWDHVLVKSDPKAHFDPLQQ